MFSNAAYIAVWVIFLGLALISLVMRLWVRLGMQGRRFDWDDGFIVLAYGLAIGEEVCLMLLVPVLRAIFANHYTTDDLIQLRKLIWIQYFIFTFACWAVKFSLLAFYTRLFYFAMKKTLVLTGVFLILSLAIVLIVPSIQCVPASKFWTPDYVMQNGQLVPGFLCPSNDSLLQSLNTVGVVLSIVSDFVVLAVPVFRVVKLKITFHQKLALIGVFAVGTIVAAVEVVRGALVLASPNSIDSVPSNIIMITVQCTLAIVVTNLPILRPLLFKRSFGSSNSGSHHMNSHTGGVFQGCAGFRSPGHSTKGSIPLHDYGFQSHVTSSPPSLNNPFESPRGIIKSVEVRVESSSYTSSGESRGKPST